MEHANQQLPQWNIPINTEVVGADGEKVGEIRGFEGDDIVLEKGFFRPTERYIPRSAIRNFDGNKVYLDMTKDQVLDQRWDRPSSMYGDQGATSGMGQTTGIGSTRIRGQEYGSPVQETNTSGASSQNQSNTGQSQSSSSSTGSQSQSQTDQGQQFESTRIKHEVSSGQGQESGTRFTDQGGARHPSETTVPENIDLERQQNQGTQFQTQQNQGSQFQSQEQEVRRIPVYEEELTATKHPVQRGEVDVTKNVTTEQQQLNVPVTEERVHVEQRTVDRDAPPDATTFQEGTIRVPVQGEDVNVQKRVRQTGEVDITKERVDRTQRVGGQVRREEVHAERTDQGNMPVDETGTMGYQNAGGTMAQGSPDIMPQGYPNDTGLSAQNYPNMPGNAPEDFPNDTGLTSEGYPPTPGVNAEGYPNDMGTMPEGEQTDTGTKPRGSRNTSRRRNRGH